MATVQISFTDASTNEESFNIYRSDDGALATVTGGNLVSQLAWDGSAWQASQGALSNNSVTIEAGSSTDSPSTPGQTFIIRYTENDSGDFKYGVTASNAIGDSDIKNSGTAVSL